MVLKLPNYEPFIMESIESGVTTRRWSEFLADANTVYSRITLRRLEVERTQQRIEKMQQYHEETKNAKHLQPKFVKRLSFLGFE